MKTHQQHTPFSTLNLNHHHNQSTKTNYSISTIILLLLAGQSSVLHRSVEQQPSHTLNAPLRPCAASLHS
ncbi:hypothetical protein DPMN_157100 [Dreissena polymorpha]|uniref:Uncharacterized protein n=1 Tax=Dreissena polymorpha TaxID=45954 RepID=A0A9D4INH2_DREPO|nr:hypothetical protein DPMN_157100 [Dreissena polymorpha]